MKCSVSVVSEPPHLELSNNHKPFSAEVSRTIVELSSVATLSTLTREGSPLGFGVRFAVDLNGTPVMCLNDFDNRFSVDRRCSLHVQVRISLVIWKVLILLFMCILWFVLQLEQCGVRTPQCTILGNLDKPGDMMALRVKRNMCPHL